MSACIDSFQNLEYRQEAFFMLWAQLPSAGVLPRMTATSNIHNSTKILSVETARNNMAFTALEHAFSALTV